jgi:ribonuclease BN (tRNA processing enzyme)
VLGAHQAESAQFRYTSILVDGILALDAGGLASTLTLDDQLRLRDVLISHRHWDHVKDVPAVGFNLLASRGTGLGPTGVNVYCAEDVHNTLTEHLLAGGFWLNLFDVPNSSDPVLRYRPIAAGSECTVGAYAVRALPTIHSVPTTGFEVTDPAGRKLYFTGDNGPGAGRYWIASRPDVLITECTFSNSRCTEAEGRLFGHLFPRQLEVELDGYRHAQGYLPRVVILHVSPVSESDIREELADVGRRLGASIEVAAEGLTFEV